MSCRQLSKNFRLSLLYFDFTGAADPLIFIDIFLYESHIVSQCALHLSTVKIERKYLNVAKSSFFKGIIIHFLSNSSLQLMVYKNTTAMNKQQLFLPVVTRLLRRHAEVKDRMPQPHDAVASAQYHGETLMSTTLKNQSPSKPQL